jgi:hypothetical protein
MSIKVSLKVLLNNSVSEVGGLSKPSKMPWYSYSIPPKFCITGSKLVDILNSVCYGCYATKNTYLYKSTVNAMQRRYNKINDPKWVEYFSKLLNYLALKEKNKDKLYFRWHDAGDIQSIEHLKKIIEIAILCPTIKFWLPTREYTIVNQLINSGVEIPNNLNIRLSAHMVGQRIDSKNGIFKQLTNSMVFEKNNAQNDSSVSYCPSSKQNGKCLDCRNCWDSSIKTIAYLKH